MIASTFFGRALLLALLVSGLTAMPVLARSAVSPQSQRLVGQGERLLPENPAQAADQFEAALAVDPANIDAYVGLGRAYERLGMQGKALRYYRGALTLDPNAVTALEAQALGYIARGKLDKAQGTLDRLRKVCKISCGGVGRVEGALAQARSKSASRTLVPARAKPVPRTLN